MQSATRRNIKLQQTFGVFSQMPSSFQVVDPRCGKRQEVPALERGPVEEAGATANDDLGKSGAKPLKRISTRSGGDLIGRMVRPYRAWIQGFI